MIIVLLSKQSILTSLFFLFLGKTCDEKLNIWAIFRNIASVDIDDCLADNRFRIAIGDQYNRSLAAFITGTRKASLAIVCAMLGSTVTSDTLWKNGNTKLSKFCRHILSIFRS